MPKLEASRVFPGTVSIVVCVCVCVLRAFASGIS